MKIKLILISLCFLVVAVLVYFVASAYMTRNFVFNDVSVLDEVEGRKILTQCSRFNHTNIESVWIPSRHQVVDYEAKLKDYVRKAITKSRTLMLVPLSYN